MLRLFDLAGVRRVFQVFGSAEEAFAHLDVSDGVPTDAVERWMTRKQRIVKNEQEFRDYNNRRMHVEARPPTTTIWCRSCVSAAIATA